MIDEEVKANYNTAVNSFEELKDAIVEISNAVKQYKQSKGVSGKLRAKQKLDDLNPQIREASNLARFLRTEVIPKLDSAIKKAGKEEGKEDLEALNIQKDRVKRMAASLLSAFEVKKLQDVNKKAFDYVGVDLDRLLRGRTLPEELQGLLDNVKVRAEKLLQSIASKAIREERFAPRVFEIKNSLDELSSRKLRRLSPQNAATILNYARSEINTLSQSTMGYVKNTSRDELTEAGASPEEIIKQRNSLVLSWNNFVEAIKNYYQNAIQYELTGKWRKQFLIYSKEFDKLPIHS